MPVLVCVCVCACIHTYIHTHTHTHTHTYTHTHTHIYIYNYRRLPFRPTGPHQCSADEQDESAAIYSHFTVYNDRSIMTLSLMKMLHTEHHNTSYVENGGLYKDGQTTKSKETPDYVRICQYSKHLFKSYKNDFQCLV